MTQRFTDPIPGNAGGLLLALVVFVASGCGSATGATPSTATPGASPAVPSVTTSPSSIPATATAPRPPRHRPRPQRSHQASPPGRRTGSLAYSTASNHVVQAQPAPGACHAIGSSLYSRPDPSCTPGALNPAVTQGTIDRTICVSGWTETVRPPESVTEQEKAASMAAYGDTGSMGAYEYDHFVPLELGGATNDPRNLWSEPGATPNPKDGVENELRREVCAGRLRLAQAQRAIVTNWVSLARHSPPPATGPGPAGPQPANAPECTLTTSYNSRYDDYDVYVHSNQPDQTVTVTDTYGHSNRWHTDASGYADVYFKAGGPAPGRLVTARVGAATCSTDL
jgi:hypothetical protein